jgi:hypothetical protein
MGRSVAGGGEASRAAERGEAPMDPADLAPGAAGAATDGKPSMSSDWRGNERQHVSTKDRRSGVDGKRR